MPFAWAQVIAEHTVKAELELRPAAGGTFESMSIFIPTGFVTIALNSISWTQTAL